MHAIEAAIGRIAAEQDNVITGEQLRAAGLGRGALARRVQAGRMQRLHHGVYLVGPAPPSFAARCRAAVLAVGEHAAVSHRAAAALHGFAPPPSGPIDVTVSGRSPRARAGITLHRSTLVRAEIAQIRGIVTTSAARAICDAAAREPTADVEQLLIDARVAHCVTDRELFAVLHRAPGRAGAAMMRALLADESEQGYSRSLAERRLRTMVKAADLPRPHFNERLCGFLVDALWPRHRLVLEVDGERFHGHPAAFEADRRRDQILVAAGYAVIRATWRQLTQQPMAVAARVAMALARAEAA